MTQHAFNDQENTMNTYTVSRTEWLRGHTTPAGHRHNSKLWDSQESAGCCLGHIGRQCAVALGRRQAYPLRYQVGWPASLFKRVSATDLYPIMGSYISTFFRQSSLFMDLYSAMVTVNDDPTLSDTERERMLSKLAHLGGFNLLFLG